MTNLSEILLESAQATLRMACPFCHGHKLGIIVDESCPVCDERHVYVECFTCGAEGPTMANADAAVEAWEGRPGQNEAERQATRSTYTRIDAGTGREHPLDDGDWPDNNRGEIAMTKCIHDIDVMAKCPDCERTQPRKEDNMTGIYYPPLLKEEIEAITLALLGTASVLARDFDTTGNEKSRRRAKALRALADRLAIQPPAA